MAMVNPNNKNTQLISSLHMQWVTEIEPWPESLQVHAGVQTLPQGYSLAFSDPSNKNTNYILYVATIENYLYVVSVRQSKGDRKILK